MSDTPETQSTQAAIDTSTEISSGPLLGLALKRAREQLGLSVEDISSRLRLSPRQVAALESDDFSALPEPMITRGFIRNYARLLDLPAEPLLDAYRRYTPSTVQRAISIPSANIVISGREQHQWQRYVVGSLLIIVAVGAWMLYDTYAPQLQSKLAAAKPEPGEAKKDTPGKEASGQNTSGAEPLPIPALPAAERQPGVEQPAPASPAQSAVPQTAPTTLPPAAPVAAPAGRLEFSFTKSTWLSVKDGNNVQIVNKIKPAQSQEVIEGQPPFQIVIGNVAASKLVFNGKPVDLAAYDKLNVARLTLE